MSVRRADKPRLDAPEAPEANAAPKAPASRLRKKPGPTSPASETAAPAAPAVERSGNSPRSLSDALAAVAHSSDEAEERYVVARDAWVAAMRTANSGRSADLATLGIAQEAYERAAVDVERWRSGHMVAFKIDADAAHHNVETAVDQEFAWRRVHDQNDRAPGRVVRLLRRITGRR